MNPTLETDVQYVKGIGESRAKALQKLGILTLRDLVSYFPRDYEDRRDIRRIRDAAPGETVCIRAMAAQTPQVRRIRKGLELCKLRAVDETGTLDITWFNQSYVKNQLKSGETYVFFGKVEGDARHKTMTNPIFEPEQKQGRATGRIMPIYRLTAGVGNAVLAASTQQGLAACAQQLPDFLPDAVRARHGLAHVRFSYENIHFPDSFESRDIARRRLIFEELFLLATGLALLKRRRVGEPGLPIQNRAAAPFLDALPFSLTGAQRRAVDEAYADLVSGAPMNRLVQGDVGSGKTVIAAACVWLAAQSGYQSAFMAPTEILAEQHFHTLAPLLASCGVRVALLTGSTRAKARSELLAHLAAGEIDLLIGTHALLTEDVSFPCLGLVVADEQHRFGVRQRAALTAKGARPHVLVMSATPIPRTLALILYGDLEVSVVDELPPGRKNVETYTIGEDKRTRMHGFVRRLTGQGRQVYIVCPMVEEGDQAAADLKNVTDYARRLREGVFPDLRVALLHGRMKPKEKDAVMSAFTAGEYDILVATTVIEVGVDVPNAALMVVENAERFGLSQLHQLRGRVGRGEHQSYCILVSEAKNDEALARLKILCQTNDGFRIAEEDLHLRGPGDFFGSRQHGLPELRIADLAGDMLLLQEAQAAAAQLLREDPRLTRPEHARLSARVRELFDLQGEIFS